MIQAEEITWPKAQRWDHLEKGKEPGQFKSCSLSFSSSKVGGKTGTQWVPPSPPHPLSPFSKAPTQEEGHWEAGCWVLLPWSIFGAGEVGRVGRFH